MSVMIQIIIVSHLCTVICLLHRPNCGATLSLKAYRLRAQDSEVKVVSLLNCQSSTIVLLNFHFSEFIVAPSLSKKNFSIVFRDLLQRKDQANKFILLYSLCDNHRG